MNTDPKTNPDLALCDQNMKIGENGVTPEIYAARKRDAKLRDWMTTEQYPSFFAQYGRKPVAGQDYDENGDLCQDDYEYFTGTGQYSDRVAPAHTQSREFDNVLITLRNDLVMFFGMLSNAWGLVPLMGIYSHYCEALDKLDPMMPLHVETLKDAVECHRLVIVDLSCKALELKVMKTASPTVTCKCGREFSYANAWEASKHETHTCPDCW